jgi:PAS domain S-box-containing protein
VPQKRSLAVVVALLAVAALFGDALLGIVNVRSMSEAGERVSATHRVLEEVQFLRSALQDAETGQRGFLLTGEPAYLEPYEVGVRDAQQRLGNLVELTRDNAAQRSAIEEISPLVLSKLDELAEIIHLRQSGPKGFEAARALVMTGEGRRRMDALRAEIAEMGEREKALLAARARESAAAARTAVATTLLAFGASLGLLGVAFVTLRKRDQERERAAGELYDEKERFRTTLRSLGDAVIVTDVNGRITSLNPTAMAVLGWDEDALGRPLEQVFRIVNEETRATVESPVAKVLRDGKVVGLANHTILIRRDESTVPIDDSGAPVRDVNGKMVGVVLVFRDIRERREAERELERRAELLKEQDRRKDAFLVMLSHELRNPLAPIRNAVTLLQRGDPGGAAAQRARDVIDRQVAQLTRLVDDLLDISRITEGKIRLGKERVSLRDSVRRTVEDHRDLFQRRGIALELAAGDAPLWVDADATRLVQIVGNLLQNAAKFTNPGGRVRVELDCDGESALLRVCDDGVGMDAATVAKLFQPFMQAETTLARTQGGLGLGLALTKGLVALHGGEVRAASQGIGSGSQFAVSLPLAEPGPEPASANGPVPAGQQLRILIIEDNQDAAATLRDVLELEGHRVRAVHHGDDGLEHASVHAPDLVLCDLGLPGLDGFEIAKRLRALGLRSCLVALTGYATPEDAERARQAGFDHHLAKPPDMEKLAAILAATRRRSS